MVHRSHAAALAAIALPVATPMVCALRNRVAVRRS